MGEQKVWLRLLCLVVMAAVLYGEELEAQANTSYVEEERFEAAVVKIASEMVVLSAKIEGAYEYIDKEIEKIKTIKIEPPKPPRTRDAQDCSVAEKSGIRTIVNSAMAMQVYCQVDESGKWTVIQRRQDGSVNFYRSWEEYKNGFGDASGEYWLGNDNIHALTSAGLTKLRIDLEDWEKTKYTVYYNVFRVAGAEEKYKLTVSDFVGSDPPNNAFGYSNNMMFSTYDQDNDESERRHCAMTSRGGGWYSDCHAANLNGEYNNTRFEQGINWALWKTSGFFYSLKKTAMMIKVPR